MSKREQWLGLVVILLLVVLVYRPGLSGGYLFDDFPNLVNNDDTVIRDLTPRQLLNAAFAGGAGPLSRPISMLSLSLERYVFGLDPGPMKLTNLFIHLANTLLVFLLVRALLSLARDRYPEQVKPLISLPALALLTTAAWSLAPINLTPVLFIIQRMESLATLFMLLGLLAYLRGRRYMEERREKRGLLWVIGGFFLGEGLGVLAKESAVMLPLYAFLIEWLFFGFGARGSVTRRYLVGVYSLVLIVPGVVGLALYLPGILSGASFETRTFSLQERLWTETRVIWHYLWWILAPAPGQLSLYHDAFPLSHGPLQPWSTLPAALGLAALATGAFLLRRRHPLLSFGILWFLVMHLLVSTVLNLELVYEHRNYMGSIGIFLSLFAVVFLGHGVQSLGSARRALAVCLIAFYGILTFQRSDEWGDPLRLAVAEGARQPESVRASYELGKVLYRIAPGPDSPLFSKATETMEYALHLPRTSLLPPQALLFEHGRLGLPLKDEWWAGMREYIASQPLASQDTNALYALITGQIEGVIDLPKDKLGLILQEAYEHNPGRHLAATLYANYLLNVRRDMEKGEIMLERAVALAPRKPQMWINLIQFQRATGQTDAAEISLSRLAELNRFGFLDQEIARLRRIAVNNRARPSMLDEPSL